MKNKVQYLINSIIVHHHSVHNPNRELFFLRDSNKSNTSYIQEKKYFKRRYHMFAFSKIMNNGNSICSKRKRVSYDFALKFPKNVLILTAILTVLLCVFNQTFHWHTWYEKCLDYYVWECVCVCSNEMNITCLYCWCKWTWRIEEEKWLYLRFFYHTIYEYIFTSYFSTIHITFTFFILTLPRAVFSFPFHIYYCYHNKYTHIEMPLILEKTFAWVCKKKEKNKLWNHKHKNNNNNQNKV